MSDENKEEGDKKDMVFDEQLGIYVRARNLSGSLEQANDELCDAYMEYKELVARCSVDFQNMQSNGLVGDADDDAPGYDEASLDDDLLLSPESPARERKGGASPPGSDQASGAAEGANSGERAASGQAKRPRRKKERPPARVFYFKPDSLLVSDPDKQRQFREKLLHQIKAAPSLSPPKLLAEELQEALIESVAERSDPREMRKVLAAYFQRKQYTLQHKRYKLLLRWAHHAIRTRNIETIGAQATFRCSKLQWEIDNSVKRGQRLEVDDDYTLGLHPELRPTSKAKKNEGTLYVEIKDLPAQSAIRADDIEVYLRHVAYSGKINKVVHKFLARLKWMPLCSRFEVFEAVVNRYFSIREENLKGQAQLLDDIDADAKESHLSTQELAEELKKIRASAHITQYQASMLDSKQQLLGSCRPDYQVSPDLINNCPEIKLRIRNYSSLYGLNADLNQDNGFSFAYQLTLFFPTYFQKQVIKSQFSIYDAFAGDADDQAQLKKRNFSSMLRVDPAIFRDIATNANLVPSEESLMDEVTRLSIHIIRLKACPWIEHVVVLPKIADWQRRQDALLSSEDNPIDTLLRGALDFLDVNDLASVNLVIAEASGIHLELIEKQKLLEEKVKRSKVSKKIQASEAKDSKTGALSKEAEEIQQTVSATSVHELNNNLYVSMSNALTGGNLTDTVGQKVASSKSAGKDGPKKKQSKTSLFNLQQHLIQSHNTLRYMNSRDAKTRVLYALNYFRAIQKRLAIDLREFGTCERVLGDVVDPLIPAQEADAQIIDTLNIVLSNTNKAKRAAEEGKLEDLEDQHASGANKLKKKMMNRASSLGMGSEANSRHNAGNGSGPPEEAGAASQYDIVDKKRMQEFMQGQGGANAAGISLVDLKKTRLDGKFHEKHLSTCPVLPRFHATFGEPSEITPEFVLNDREQKEVYISKDSMKYLNRIDHIEIDEARSEVYVKDDFSIYLMYECSLTDMQILEEELLRIGTYYITKLEDLYDTEIDKVCHKKDRQQVLNDLLNCEMHFQFRKVLLTQLYMECYEHVCDPVEQQRLCQIITDLMARRPRLNLDDLYFQDSYRAEVACIDKHIELLDMVIQNQIKLEKSENTNLHEALNLSYSLAQKKARDGWGYDDQDQYLNNLIDKFYAAQASQRVDLGEDQLAETQDGTNRNESLAEGGQEAPHSPKQTAAQPKPAGSADPPLIKDFQKPGFQMRNMRYTDQELDQEAFTKLLGLPKVTLEQLFQQSKENDEVVQDIMAEQSHYVNLLEGYPDLMSLKHSGRALDNRKHLASGVTEPPSSVDLSLTGRKEPDQTTRRSASHPDEVDEISVRLNKWLTRSQAMSVMDFYQDALMCISKLQATLTSCFNELVDVLKPHDNMMRSILECQVHERAIQEYREMQMFVTGDQVETRGHQYIESEYITGSSDKMMFYIKDFVSEFERGSKAALNPFLVAKLDIPALKAFKFPQRVPVAENPYLLKKDGLLEGKSVSIALAEQKFHDPAQFRKCYLKEVQAHEARHWTQPEQEGETSEKKQLAARIQPPSLLFLQCNAVELLRLRSELMNCLSECVALQNLYRRQVKTCNRASLQPLYSEGLAFEHGLLEEGELSFLDDGPASMLDIELAINEIDPMMASNLNFRSADAFKMMVTPSGLEEVRVILHYQMMQKQALIVATRTNQIIMDTHLRALQELQLVKRGHALPNMVIPVSALYTKISEGIDSTNYGKLKSRYTTNLSNNVSSCIVSIGQWKSLSRTSLSKKYQEMMAICEKSYWQKEIKLRLLRSYKVSLFNQYCNQTLEQAYANSVRYNLVAQCQKLRALNQYFQFNPSAMSIETGKSDNSPQFSQLFNLETNDFIENLFDWYGPARTQKDRDEYNKLMEQKQSMMNQQDGAQATLVSAKQAKVETLDWKKRQLLDRTSIPSTATLMQLEPFGSAEEQAKFLRSSLDKVRFDEKRPAVEGTELYDAILPTITCMTPIEDSSVNDQHIAPRRKLLDYGQMELSEIYKYFHHIENIISLELSVSKFIFAAADVIEMDSCIQSGMPFFQTHADVLGSVTHDLAAIINSGKAAPDIGLTETGKTLKEREGRLQTKNLLATKILNKMVASRRMKSDIGEELHEVALRIQAVLAEAHKHGAKTQPGNSFPTEYLQSYEQIRYLQIVATIQKLQAKYFERQEIKAGLALNDTLLALCKRDHVKIQNTNGTFHVNSSELEAEKLSLESSSLSPHSGSLAEQISFKKCIHPILSDKALEPPEFTLLESIFLNNHAQNPTLMGSRKLEREAEEQTGERKTPLTYSDFGSHRRSQFAGQPTYSAPFAGSGLSPMQTFLLCMKSEHRKYIASNLKQADPLLRDYLMYIVQENVKEDQRAFTFMQLTKARRYLTDQIESRQLWQASLCFIGHEVPAKLNQDKEMMKRIEADFKQNFFWMILKEKDMLKDAQDAKYRTSASELEMVQAQRELEQEIRRLKEVNERKITDEDMSRANKLRIKALEEEQRRMKRNVLLDSILTARAQIAVHSQEIERFVISAAVRTLDSESHALANCLKNQAAEVDACVHPFQQFAVTLYDRVDPKSHLDAINKCSHIQSFMTRLKNRGTEVETLTSGPGYVFTLKDINDCVGTLSKGLLKYAEAELRSQAEMAAKKEQHYRELLYAKDQKIEHLERRLAEQVRVVDKMVNSRMYEKGNAIVYELDQANRSLKLLKDNIHTMEDRIRKEIDWSYRNKLHHRETALYQETRKFADYKESFKTKMDQQVSENQKQIRDAIKKKADAFRNLDAPSPAKHLIDREQGKRGPPDGRAAIQEAQRIYTMKLQGSGEVLSTRGGRPPAIAPAPASPGIRRRGSRYITGGDEILSGPYEFPAALQEVWAMDEQEARAELAHLCDRARLMFVFWKVKEVTMRQKYEDQLFNLNQKLSSNSMLWEQLAEAEKRERILRQELVLTQQGLSTCEKVVEKQRDHINKLDTEKVRLQNFKQNKGRRLDELEHKVAQYEMFEKIDVEKLIAVLDRQDKEVRALRADSVGFRQQLEQVRRANKQELREVYRKFRQETGLKNLAVENLENMRQEIRALELNSDQAVQTIWKEKCQELYQICLQIKEENSYLTDRCKQMAELAVSLMTQLSDGPDGAPAEDSKRPADSLGALQLHSRGLSDVAALERQKQSLRLATTKRQSKDLAMSLPKLAPADREAQDTALLRNAQALRQSTKNMETGGHKLLLETSMASNDRAFEYPPLRQGAAPKSRKRHNRGRSLLEIKNEVSQRNSRLGAAVLGHGLSKDATTDASRSPHASLGFGAKISKERTPGEPDSLLDASVTTQRPNIRSRDNSKLGGFSSSTNKGFAGILGHSSMADYSQNLKQINELSLLGADNIKLGLDQTSTKNIHKNKQKFEQQSFYNMKSKMGIHKLYPSKDRGNNQATNNDLNYQ